jgi:hypothetical protein
MRGRLASKKRHGHDGAPSAMHPNARRLPTGAPCDPRRTGLRRGCAGRHATLLSEMHHGGPQQLHALLLELSLNFLASHDQLKASIPLLTATRSGTEITLGVDKGYHAQEFIDACVEMEVVPHVAHPSSTPNPVFPTFCPLVPNKIKHLALHL